MKAISSKYSLVVILIFLVGCTKQPVSLNKKTENIKAFAKLYGYVRWFHPSDEAQQINWDKFAIYGVKTVENATNVVALKDSLLKLFLPIAPALDIYQITEKSDFDISKIIPADTSAYKPVFWQHSGVKLNETPLDTYHSLRINRIDGSDFFYVGEDSNFDWIAFNIGTAGTVGSF